MANNSYRLGSLNVDGFKESLKDWNDVGDAMQLSGDSVVQQLIQQRKCNPSFIRLFFSQDNRSLDEGITILKQQFRTSDNASAQAYILSEIVQLIIQGLKRSNGKHQDDHITILLKDKEELAEDVLVTFFQHPDPEIAAISPVFLRSFLKFAFASYTNKKVLKSIWRYLNRFQDPQCWKLIRDILVSSCDHSFQAELLCISFEYLIIDRQQSDAADFLLLLAVRLQDESEDHKLRRYLNVINKVIDKVLLNSTQIEVILYSVGRMLEMVSVFLLPPLIDLIMKLLSLSAFSSLTLNIILDPIIQWFSRPCPFIPAETYRAFGTILKKAQELPVESKLIILEDLSTWDYLMEHDREVTIAIYYTRLNIKLQIHRTALHNVIKKWQRVSAKDFNVHDIRLIRSIILSPHFPDHLTDVLNQFRVIMGASKIPQPMPITPFLFKLVQERNPKCQLQLLKILPEFATNPSNIPIILSTIRKFDKIPGLDLLCLELYYEMSKREYRPLSRVIDHLDYLQAKKNKSTEMCLAIISIVRRICLQKKGGQNCREMVKFVSHIINEDCANHHDGVVMVIALDAIQILCENATISVQSTWQAIRDNFKDEDRKNVKLKLYDFFRVIPRLLNSDLAADESLLDEIMTILWREVLREKDQKVIESAFNALKEYPYDTMRFIRFPEMFRENVKLPKSHLNTVSDEEYVETFPYVPGECWLEMLEKVPKIALNSISIFISKFIDLELKTSRTHSTALAEGRQEPKTITGVQPKSILKALLNYLVVETRNDFPDTEDVRMAIVKCLAIGFSKPLPSFDWSFLGGIYEQTESLRTDCLKIICRQAEVSLSAGKLLQNYLEKLNVQSCGLEHVLILMETFHGIAKNMTINEAEILLTNCLKSHPQSDDFITIMESLNVQELNSDLRRIVEEEMMERYSRMAEVEVNSARWTLILQKMGSDFVNELTQPLTEELTIKKQVDDLLKSPQRETSTEKIILLQLVASKLKLSKDADELEFYGNLLIKMVTSLSKLAAIDSLDMDDDKERSKCWGRYLQVLCGQPTVKEGMNQVLTCINARVSNDDSTAVAKHLKLGLVGVGESHVRQV